MLKNRPLGLESLEIIIEKSGKDLLSGGSLRHPAFIAEFLQAVVNQCRQLYVQDSRILLCTGNTYGALQRKELTARSSL